MSTHSYLRAFGDVKIFNRKSASKWNTNVIKRNINLFQGLSRMFTFLVEGVLMFIVGCLGLGGNLFSLTLLLKRKAQKTFHNLLLLHCSFDMVGGNVNLLSIGCCVLNKGGLRRKPKNHKRQSHYNNMQRCSSEEQ